MPLGGSGSEMMAAYRANRKLLRKRKSLKDVYDSHLTSPSKSSDNRKSKSTNSREYLELKEKFEIERKRDNMKRILLILFLAFLGVIIFLLLM